MWFIGCMWVVGSGCCGVGVVAGRFCAGLLLG